MNPFNPSLLAGQTVLITGGGSGLGLSMAKRFAELGANLVICGRREDALNTAAGEIRAGAEGVEVRTIACDIRDPAAVAAMMDQIWLGAPPTILVNNAAASFIAQTHLLSHRAADAILGVTLHGALYCTLEVGRRWIEAQTPGVVLTILSTSTITGRAFTVPSAIAKSGLLAMTRSLAVEWGPRNIRLLAIAPGLFPTAATEAQLNPASRAGGSAPSVPLGRVGRHDELANLASYLVSDASAYLNGDMVVFDGGLHLRTSGIEDLVGWTDEQWADHRAKK